MARIRLENIIDQHASDIRRALVAAVENQLPEADLDGSQLLRDFKRQIGRKLSNWTRVRDSDVEVG
jgi:hypothetical protein